MKTAYLLGLVVAFILTPLSRVNAYIGSETRPGDSTPETLTACRIIMRDEANEISNLCTGTLIEDNKVLTAAHCFEDEPSVRSTTVRCGYQFNADEESEADNFKSGYKFAIKNVSFTEDAIPVHDVLFDNGVIGSERPKDVALLLLARKSTIKPALVELDYQRATDCFRNGSLFAAGYGVNPRNVLGTLTLARYESSKLMRSNTSSLDYFSYSRIPDTDSRIWERIKDNLRAQREFAVAGGYLKAQMMGGDSGGPIFCKQSDDEQAKVIGVTSAGDVFVERSENSDIEISGYNRWERIRLDRLVSQEVYRKTDGPARRADQSADREDIAK